LIAWKSAAIHLDVLAVGLGVVPFLLGAAGRTRGSVTATPAPRVRALTPVSLPLLALETASYDVRFGGSSVVRDRYLFYLAPLLLLATRSASWTSASLVGIAARRRSSRDRLLRRASLRRGLWVDSPESVLNGSIHDRSGRCRPGLRRPVRLVLGRACSACALVRGRARSSA
jgi:hypothetical protein